MKQVLTLLASVGLSLANVAPQFPIAVINLDRDRERLASVSKELEAAGVSLRTVQRLAAVNGAELTEEELKENTTLLARLFATRGMIGCYLSHRTFWERTLAAPQPWAVVLEDDVRLTEDFCRKTHAAIAELEACPETAGGNWDVLLLGALGCVEPKGKYGLNRMNAFVAGGGRQARQVTDSIHVPRRPFGTHAYALSRRGAAKLLRRASLAAYHVDAVCWGMPDLNLYSCAPMLAHQAFETPSTIGAIVGGPETKLTHKVVDKYTGVTFAWAFNEPVIRLPVLNVVLTIGRCLVFLALGYLAGGIALAMDVLRARRADEELASLLAGWPVKYLLAHSVLVKGSLSLVRALAEPKTKPEAVGAVDKMMTAVALHAAAEFNAREWWVGSSMDKGADLDALAGLMESLGYWGGGTALLLDLFVSKRPVSFASVLSRAPAKFLLAHAFVFKGSKTVAREVAGALEKLVTAVDAQPPLKTLPAAGRAPGGNARQQPFIEVETVESGDETSSGAQEGPSQ